MLFAASEKGQGLVEILLAIAFLFAIVALVCKFLLPIGFAKVFGKLP